MNWPVLAAAFAGGFAGAAARAAGNAAQQWRRNRRSGKDLRAKWEAGAANDPNWWKPTILTGPHVETARAGRHTPDGATVETVEWTE